MCDLSLAVRLSLWVRWNARLCRVLTMSMRRPWVVDPDLGALVLVISDRVVCSLVALPRLWVFLVMVMMSKPALCVRCRATALVMSLMAHGTLGSSMTLVLLVTFVLRAS